MIPNLSDLLGYAGSACLALRFIPIVKDYYCNNFFEYNPALIFLEVSADILLGTSGYLIESKPMVIANGICLTVTLSLLVHSTCRRNRSRIRWAPYGSLYEN